MVILESPEKTFVESYNLNLVTFRNVFSSYTLDKDIVVEFEMDSQLKGSTWDWVAIFKEGWNTYESYLVFEWGIGRPCEGRRRKIKFSSKYLNKHVSIDTNYQFVYISRYLEILGESSYFQFKLPLIQTVSRICDISSVCDQGKDFYHGDVSNCLLKKFPLIKNVFTSCAHCKNVLQCPTSEDKAIMEYEAKYLELEKKIENLECVLETLLSRLKIDNNICDMGFYDPNKGKEIHSGKEAVRPVENTKNGDDKRAAAPPPCEMSDVPSCFPDYKSQLAHVESEASLILKAIIGRQEHKIRELTHFINKKKKTESNENSTGDVNPPPRVTSRYTCRTEPIEQHVVKITQTQEKMLAEIFNLNNNCEEYSNEAELNEKNQPEKTVLSTL